MYPADEWQAIALNYTSGTTGNPKGVVYHHRGAHLNAVGNALVWSMPQHPVYLWTLPMFHCNGWCFPWTVALQAGTQVCLRKVAAETIFAAIAERGVTHLCGAPDRHGHARERDRRGPPPVRAEGQDDDGGGTPARRRPGAMERLGIEVTHVYGLTEVYGPATVCAWHEEWSASTRPPAPPSSRAKVCATPCWRGWRSWTPRPWSPSRATERPWARS
jgi:fatty-acyl-CoA synthase